MSSNDIKYMKPDFAYAERLCQTSGSLSNLHSTAENLAENSVPVESSETSFNCRNQNLRFDAYMNHHHVARCIHTPPKNFSCDWNEEARISENVLQPNLSDYEWESSSTLRNLNRFPTQPHEESSEISSTIFSAERSEDYRKNLTEIYQNPDVNAQSPFVVPRSKNEENSGENSFSSLDRVVSANNIITSSLHNKISPTSNNKSFPISSPDSEKDLSFNYSWFADGHIKNTNEEKSKIFFYLHAYYCLLRSELLSL